MLLTLLNANNDIYKDVAFHGLREPSSKLPLLTSLVHAAHIVVCYTLIAANWMGVCRWSWVHTKLDGEDRTLVRIIRKYLIAVYITKNNVWHITEARLHFSAYVRSIWVYVLSCTRQVPLYISSTCV